ncbi:MAG: acyltransferase [Gallionella sp.]|nr:acyltransferase [Gallionella sp.]
MLNKSHTAEFESATIPMNRMLPGLHGLRGIAAVAIVLYHLAHLANVAVPTYFSFIASEFSYAVHLFFVLSAFSLMHSTEHTMHRTAWVNEYFIKRFFRIAPLYYAIMAGMILWPVIIKSHAVAFDIPTILLNLTFTFGFAPWSGIVWAGWTVGVEMLFYAIFPMLLLTVRSTSGTFFLVIISIVVAYAARVSLHEHFAHTYSMYKYNWAYFSFASNICFFAMGMYAFRLARPYKQASHNIQKIVPIFCLTLLGILLLTDLENPLQKIWEADLLLWGAGFAALCIWQSDRPSLWSANWLFEYLGERSYSIYLLHPVVIVLLKGQIQWIYNALVPHMGAYAYFVCALLLLMSLLAIAELTYRMIEIPGIHLGKMIITRTRVRKMHSEAAKKSAQQDTDRLHGA